MSLTDWTLHYLHFAFILKNPVTVVGMEFGTSFVDKETGTHKSNDFLGGTK